MLSKECVRRDEFEKKVSNMKLLLRILVDHECTAVRSSENDLTILEKGIKRLLHTHQLDEDRSLPGHRAWLHPHVEALKEEFTRLCRSSAAGKLNKRAGSHNQKGLEGQALRGGFSKREVTREAKFCSA